MKFFNATVAIAIAAALPSTTSATLRGEERKLQDEVGSMPIDAIEPVEPMHGGGHGSGYGGGGYGGYFNKIFDATCELAAELVDERLEKACDNASDFLMESCPGHGSGSWDHDGHDDCCQDIRRLEVEDHDECCINRRRLEVHQGHDDCCGGTPARRLGSHGGHGGEPLCEPLCQEVGDFFGSYCVRHRGGHGGGWGHDGHGDPKVRKLKDTSSLMLQIDEVRKLQGSTEATPAIMEAVESFGALAVLGPDKFSDFKCEEAADIVDGRLEKACDNAEALLEFCPRRCHCGGMGGRQLSGHGGHDDCCKRDRRLGGHGGGGWGRGGDASVTLELCFELCDEVGEFFESYCWDIHGRPPCKHKECLRRLGGEIETVPHHRHLALAERLRGDLAGAVASKDDILPASAADTLRAHVEGLYDAEGYPPVASLPGKGNYEMQVYTHDLDGSELIDMIGKDNTKNLLDFFYETMGAKVPVTNIKLQLGKHMDEGQYFDYHIDESATLVVFLNDNDHTFHGGDNRYVTNEGNIVVPVKKGRAVAHGPNTVHGVSLWQGDRVVLSLEGGSVLDKCMLEDILEA